MKIKLYLASANQIIRNKGFAEDGHVQVFHTKNVLGRIKWYMPNSGSNSSATYKITVAQTDIRKPEIVTDVPYGKYLFYGKKMVNAKTGKGPALIPGVGYRYKKGTILKPTDSPLDYTRTKNPQAGPHWDRTLVNREGRAITADLQRYIDRRSGK